MKKVVIGMLLILALAATAKAESLKGGYGACLTEDLFDQLSSAAVKHDERAFAYLLKNGCIITKAGIEVSVLDTSMWSGKVKVRAYVGDSAVVLWTNVENIRK